ncbi:MAG: toxin-antitoxin system HicB family antitoxin [Dehalococcoides mccartyi]|jgi:predicted HicB family RNase H-like nuclease|uniref:toxin-antitoxin system HicB family antitoxin n=1 Tax=Dehalococcoides mccartyi TaxID=61435 RepID=UPI0030F851C4
MDKKQAKSKPEIRMIHIRLPEDIHKKVRVRAAEADVTIQDWVLEAIQEHLKPSGEKGEQRQ